VEFSRIFVDPDVSNHEVIGTDDVATPFPGLDFLHREPVLFSELEARSRFDGYRNCGSAASIA
jgi:hypothetical protein